MKGTKVSKRGKARRNVLCENMVHRRALKPRSAAFKADVTRTHSESGRNGSAYSYCVTKITGSDRKSVV